MLAIAYILPYLRRCPSELPVSDVHLIAARISFAVEHSHWPLKELFPLLSPAPPLMRPLGVN